jgi:hypothetical protein
MNMTKRLHSLNMMFEGGRAFVAATVIIYLLSKGVSLAEIAMLKIFQSVAVIFLEVPTGFVSDYLGHKKSLVASTLFCAIGYMFFLNGTTFNHFIVAEFFNACCLALWSGAYDAFAIEKLDIGKNEDEMAQFFHMSSSCQSAVVIICGLSGAYLALYQPDVPFIVSISFLIASSVFAFSFSQSTMKKSIDITEIKNDFLVKIKSAFRYGTKDPITRKYFAMLCVLQALMMPIIFYWQPFFESLSNYVGGGNGIVHSAMNATFFILGIYLSKSKIRGKLQSPKVLLGLFACLGSSFWLLAHCDSFVAAIIVFCVLEGFFMIIGTSIKIGLNKEIDGDSRATILSSASMFARIGALSSLMVLKISLGDASSGDNLLHEVYQYCGIIILLISFGIACFGLLKFSSKVATN